MSGDAEGKGKYGAVVPVRDLDRMRKFYCETLQLGAPIMDSTFWVEFRLPGAGILALEQRDSAKPPEEGQGISWLLGVADLAKESTRLEQAEVRPRRPSQDIPGVKCRSFRDPEGNPFTLYETGETGSGTQA